MKNVAARMSFTQLVYATGTRALVNGEGRKSGRYCVSCCDRGRDTSQGTRKLRIFPVCPSLDRVRVFDFNTGASHVKTMQKIPLGCCDGSMRFSSFGSYRFDPDQLGAHGHIATA